MKEMHIAEPGLIETAVEAIRRDAILVQLPTVFVLLAPATREGVEWLNRKKQRLPEKNYGSAIGNLDQFAAMVTPGTVPPELAKPGGFEVLKGAFIRCHIASPVFQSALVRRGTHQGVLLDGPHHALFAELEAGLADMADPDLLAGHVYTAPLCTSCNMSGHPLGSITEWDRARGFALERRVPLIIRCDPANGNAGSYPIFEIERNYISIQRDGPRMDEIRAALPQRLFARAA
jgi:tRNA A37 threonylcarbamoyladenosine synthetase subunit TsaC/SUA5/YrdC